MTLGEMRNVFKTLVEHLKEKEYSGCLGIDGKIILKWTLQKDMKECTRFFWLREGKSGGLC
jgi:hypothetical protein